MNARRVTLTPLPVELVPAGQHVEVDGRTAEIVAERSADYRAVSDFGTSQTRTLRVSDRRLVVRAKPGRVSVRVIPPAPYARINLELRLRDRFGWWPQERRRLDYLSEATFRIRGPARARVALVERDGWTHRALSRVVRVPRVR